VDGQLGLDDGQVAPAGLLVRRTLPAMALTAAVFVALQVLVPDVVRPHLLPRWETKPRSLRRCSAG
jgi:hypothetical protein